MAFVHDAALLAFAVVATGLSLWSWAWVQLGKALK